MPIPTPPRNVPDQTDHAIQDVASLTDLTTNEVRFKLMDWVLMLALSTRARRVLGLLVQMARHDPNDELYLKCFPSQRTIAAKLGISIRTVARAMAELKEKGHVSVQLIRTSLGKDKIRHELTVYRLNAPFSKVPESLENVALSKSTQESQVLPPKTANGAPVSKVPESLGNVASHNEAFKERRKYSADAHNSDRTSKAESTQKERPNISKARRMDKEWTEKKRQFNRRRLDDLGITKTDTIGGKGVREFCLNADYIDHAYNVLRSRHFNKDRTVNELRDCMEWKIPAKRGQVIEQCLSSLKEKNCFATDAVHAVFRNPYQAWHIIGGCNWKCTTGKALVGMLK